MQIRSYPLFCQSFSDALVLVNLFVNFSANLAIFCKLQYNVFGPGRNHETSFD